MLIFNILTSIIYFLSCMLLYIKTPLNSIICLAIILFLSSIILICIRIEFLSYIFLLIYIGGIVLLFLFVVIMLNIKIINVKNKDFNLFIGPIISFLLIIKLQSYMLYFFKKFINGSLKNICAFNYDLDYYMLHFESNDINILGLTLYTEYFFYFIIIGIVLLVSMLSILTLSSKSNVLK